MTEVEKKQLLDEYHQRNVRWTDKALAQLSYFNNLMLTLSVGFISFSYKILEIQKLIFSIKNIDLSSTFMILSLIAMFLSTVKGIVISLNRLMDFRITRQVVQIRQRMLEHADRKMDESTPKKMPWCERQMLIKKLYKQYYPEISIEDCKYYKEKNTSEKKRIDGDFEELRKISHNLGINTWKGTYCMVIFFGLSLFFYLLSILVRWFL